MNTQLKPGIHWVGYVDWNVRDFHDFDTPRGATYNSYLIQDEKNVVIDAVKGPFVEFFLRNLSQKVPLEKIDYIVCNHAELDHSGGLPEVMSRLPHATLLCNAKCRDALASFFPIGNWNIRIVSPEDKIPIGTRSLKFLDTPMVHWPESMFTYVPEEKLLFSMDAFGQHLAGNLRFDEQWKLEDIMHEAKTYYANIVTPYGKQVLKTLDAAAAFPIEMIAPSHGMIWKRHLPDILEAYKNWASGTFTKKVLILYDSMWGSTERMGEEILHGASKTGDPVEVHLMHVRKTSGTDIAAEMLDASCVALGSATLHGQIMPQMSALLTYFKGLRFREKTAFAFGSSGWGIGAPEHLQKSIEELRWTPITEPIRARNRPDAGILQRCCEAGEKLAEIAGRS